jgi:hypothetical protein
MSDIDLAVTRSQRLEQRLEKDFGATGKGLHQKVSSVEGLLPQPLVRKLRLVATVRNKVVHESGRIDDRDRFVEAADASERELKALSKSRRGRGGTRKLKLTAILITVALALVVAVVLMWFT